MYVLCNTGRSYKEPCALDMYQRVVAHGSYWNTPYAWMLLNTQKPVLERDRLMEYLGRLNMLYVPLRGASVCSSWNCFL